MVEDVGAEAATEMEENEDERDAVEDDADMGEGAGVRLLTLADKRPLRFDDEGVFEPPCDC